MVQEALNRFGELDGVGPDMATHLWNAGMRTKEDIASSDPEHLYKKDCELAAGEYVDRCVLYVYRCVQAVCEAEMNNQPLDPPLHKWWNWSDKKIDIRKQSERNLTG